MKYYNDAIIGNKNMVATYSEKGELLRLLYPSVDYKQFIDFFKTGVKINDSNLIQLQDDINNTYYQYYTENTNILNTEILNTYFNLKIKQTDFILMKENVLIKKYTFKNEGNINLDVDFLIHSKIESEPNHQTAGIVSDNILMQYMHGYSICTFSDTEMLSYQINNTSANIHEGVISGKDYVGLTNDSSISYKIGILKPQEEKSLNIYVYITENSTKMNTKNILKYTQNIKKIDVNKELNNTKKYWRNYVKTHSTLEVDSTKSYREKRIEKIYKRTILLYALLMNSETGGIVAAIEPDENYNQCGGYSYCWPRDAIFITKAMRTLNMKREIEKFYKNFCAITQSSNGMWEQRFYLNGNLAPGWGYQIDETASVVYGIYEYYKLENNINFIKENIKMCEKATKFLEKYIDNIITDNKKMQPTYDLWEMHEEIDIYSLSAIFGAFFGMIKIYEALKLEYENNRLKIEEITNEIQILEKYLVVIKEYILTNMYDNEKKSFVKSKNNRIMDISILGITTFDLMKATETKVQNTIERINLTLRTYTGGYLRFEKDHYRGGNPWTIANLWLAEYYLKAGKKEEALECFNFVVNTATKHGFIAEQIKNETLQVDWVIGLGWAHAMFINLLEQFLKM